MKEVVEIKGYKIIIETTTNSILSLKSYKLKHNLLKRIPNLNELP